MEKTSKRRRNAKKNYNMKIFLLFEFFAASPIITLLRFFFHYCYYFFSYINRIVPPRASIWDGIIF